MQKFKISIIVCAVFLSVYCGSNKLHEYDFREFTAAAVIDAPASAGIATAPDINMDKKNPFKTIRFFRKNVCIKYK